MATLIATPDAQVIVNTTPVGMYPNTGVAPVDLSMFPRLEGVLDLIYNPARTQLLLDAERLGVRCANGLHMLVAQAKLASELFRDTKLDDGIIDRVRARIERDTHNIVLIGMPGSGKTTLGERIAERLNRRLIDTDESLLTITGGRDAASIIRNEGEAEFRRIETQAVREAGMQSGCGNSHRRWCGYSERKSRSAAAEFGRVLCRPAARTVGVERYAATVHDAGTE